MSAGPGGEALAPRSLGHRGLDAVGRAAGRRHLLSATMRRLFGPAGRVTVGMVAVALGTIVGLAIGIGAYTFVYARGASYMTNDPNACANCHIMREQLDGWIVSSHRSV